MGVDILGVTGVDVRTAGGDLRVDFELLTFFVRLPSILEGIVFRLFFDFSSFFVNDFDRHFHDD